MEGRGAKQRTQCHDAARRCPNVQWTNVSGPRDVIYFMLHVCSNLRTPQSHSWTSNLAASSQTKLNVRRSQTPPLGFHRTEVRLQARVPARASAPRASAAWQSRSPPCPAARSRSCPAAPAAPAARSRASPAARSWASPAA
eukprot:9487389-Pyramimonas_sp.AAC.1